MYIHFQSFHSFSMSRVCPRPCGRLAAAAIFISVGVIQLVAGIFLLKSEYVYLLSAPDFWTSFCNIAVGGLLGVSAGVWRNTSKKNSKHAVRRNVLAALMTSAILINSTTSAIFVLGEGNALLSIHLENNGIYTSATLAREILAYAYAASVCSPIFCVVVSIIFLSGMCFPNGKKNLDIKNISENDSTFKWVYKPKQRGLPIPDPEIVRKVLSSKSFTSSDDSSTSTESPIRRDSMQSFDTSLMRGISAIQTQNGNEFPHTAHHCVENQAKTSIRRNKNRISFADEPSVNGGKVQETIQPTSESIDQCYFQRIKMEKGDLPKLGCDSSRNVREIEELQKLEDIHGIYHPHDTAASTVPNASMLSERCNHILNRDAFKKTECVSPDENFGDNLHCLEHKNLRRTSTEASLPRIHIQKMSQSLQDGISGPSESLTHAMAQKSISLSCNSALQNSEQTLHDQNDLPTHSRSHTFLGEVVPIQVNTFPRKKLQSKLIPVSIPVVSSVKNGSLSSLKECKFDDPRKEGFSSFHAGRQMKNRSRSTGSYSAKHSAPTSAKQNVAVFEVPVEETNSQLSPAHTSGYVSPMEDIEEPTSRDSSKSAKTPTSNSSGRSGSSSYVSPRDKFRAAQRKILDGGRSVSKKNVINDILEEIIAENPLLSSKESINELFYKLLLQKVTHELEDY